MNGDGSKLPIRLAASKALADAFARWRKAASAELRARQAVEREALRQLGREGQKAKR